MVNSIYMNPNTFLFKLAKQIQVVLEEPYIVLAHLVAIHPDAVGSLASDKKPSDTDNFTMALGHRVQPLAALATP